MLDLQQEYLIHSYRISLKQQSYSAHQEILEGRIV